MKMNYKKQQNFTLHCQNAMRITYLFSGQKKKKCWWWLRGKFTFHKMLRENRAFLEGNWVVAIKNVRSIKYLN